MIYLGLFLGIFVVLALVRVPVGFSMGIASVVVLAVANLPLASVQTALFSGLNSFTFLAIPAFIFAGDIMGASGISNAVLNFANSIIGRLRGAVGATAIVTSLLFGTLTGSSVATVTAIGSMMLPEMEKRGYDKKYSTALISCCGFLGILVPPSIPGVIYSMMSGESLLRVWLCTLVPGILVALVYIGINYFYFGRKEEKAAEPFRMGTYFVGIGRSLKSSIVALLMPVIIFYGIYGGIFTPTEAGGVAVFYGLLVGWVIMPLWKKKFPEKRFHSLLADSVVSSASITFILAFAAVCGKMITFTRVSETLTQFLFQITDNKYIFLLVLNVILLIVGMFLETNTAIMLLGPILIPVAVAYGVDPIHFAAIMLLNMEIGMITPPMAGNLFVGCRIANLNIDDILPWLVPFWIGCVVVLMIITYIPQLVLFIPSLV